MISQAQGFYQNAKDVICNGRSYRFGPEVLSYRHPKGWQAVVRVSNDETKALAVIHTFASPVPEKIVFELPVGGNWEIKRKFASVSEVSFENGKIYITPEGEFSGLACILEKS
jgi:alpha-galactosidase